MNKDSQADPNASSVDAYCDCCGWPAGLPVLAAGDAVLNGQSAWRITAGPVFNFGPLNAHRSCYDRWHKFNAEEVQS